MYLWDGMHQTISMNHVHPPLARDYIRTFLQFQQVRFNPILIRF